MIQILELLDRDPKITVINIVNNIHSVFHQKRGIYKKWLN